MNVYLEKFVSLVKLLGAVDGTIFIKNHFKGDFGLSGISEDAGTHFTSTEFKDECQTRGVCLTLLSPEHKEIW